MTSRCRRTGLVRYPTKTKATAAIRKAPLGSPLLDTAPCDHRGRHFHVIPHGEELPRQPGVFDAAEWDDATMQLWARCRDACEWCARPLAGQMVRHHRMRRQAGGDRLANLTALHDPCHRYVHAHPLEAKDRGFIVPPQAGDPAKIRLTLTDGTAWWLTDGGLRIPG